VRTFVANARSAPTEMASSRLPLVATALFGALAPLATAQAQVRPDIALNQYEHTMAGDAFFGVPTAAVGDHLMARAMVTLDAAKDPLVLYDANDERAASPVSSQVHLHLGASYALWSRLMVSLDFPFAISQSGDDADLGGGTTLAGASGTASGDLRVGLRGRIHGEYWDAFQIGAAGYLYAPTGGSEKYTAEGAVYGQPHLLVSGRIPYFVYSAKAGAYLRGSDNPHSFSYAVGFAASLLDDNLTVGPEILGAVDFEDRELVPGLSRAGNVNAELLVGAQYRFLDDFNAGVAGGPGLADGVGTPQLRVLARFAYDPRPPKEEPPIDSDGDRILDPMDACPQVPGPAHQDPTRHGCPPADRDGDRIVDDSDACPDQPGIPSESMFRNGCPPPSDRDGDAVVDEVDACPDVAGITHEDPAKNGCPPDRDGDSVIDAMDACPDVVGVAQEDPAKNGCPPDSDGDGILDAEDACPREPGTKNADPTKNGCPRVVITDKEVLILQKVEFDLDKATIKAVSNSLLDEVAQTLKGHPELAELEVQGHTDDKGAAWYNKRLSQQRAEAVVAALVERGIDDKRLAAKGYGEGKPIASNKTEEGQAKNRRVQFTIVRRDDSLKKPAAQAPAPAPPASGS
jgi:OmpA-OmpF porin, OOP family